MKKKTAQSSNAMLQRIMASSKVPSTVFTDTTMFEEEGDVPTIIPMYNVALSGDMEKGVTSGLLQIVGPSKHFKSMLGLLCVKAYLDAHPDAVCVFYDSEFGSRPSYFKGLNVDTNRVVHKPIVNIEELKFDITSLVEEINPTDNVIIFVDSIGNLASKKEAEDAKDSKDKADMSRPKQMNSLFRIVTPYLTIRKIPMIVVNHAYDTMEFISKTVVSGGTKSYLSANTILMMSRAQEKEKDKFSGFRFTITIEKSRTVKEKSKFPIYISMKKGINVYSGLLEEAVEYGIVIKPKMAHYSRLLNGLDSAPEETMFKEDATNTKEFWEPLLKDVGFKTYVKDKYTLKDLTTNEETIEEYLDDEEE